MSPETFAILIQGGIAMAEAIRSARKDDPGLSVPRHLKKQLRAEIRLLSDELNDDIEAELERRLALEERAES